VIERILHGDLDAGDHIAVDFVDGAFTFATTKRELAAVEAGPSGASDCVGRRRRRAATARLGRHARTRGHPTPDARRVVVVPVRRCHKSRIFGLPRGLLADDARDAEPEFRDL